MPLPPHNCHFDGINFADRKSRAMVRRGTIIKEKKNEKNSYCGSNRIGTQRAGAPT